MDKNIKYQIIRLSILATILTVILVFGAVFAYQSGLAEEYEEAYILCMPNDYVNVREHANKKGEPLGYLTVGDTVYLDGKERNGFVHCVNMTLEFTDGWIYKGYIVYDEPEYMYRNATIVSKGRLAARKFVNGKRKRWLKPMATVKVYYWSDEWCVTNCGYVKSEFLELEGE